MPKLVKRGNVWHARGSYKGIDLSGSLGTTDSNEAQAKLGFQVYLIERGCSPKSDRVLFKDVVKKYLAVPSLKAVSTRSRVDSLIARHLLPFFGLKMLGEITRDLLAVYISGRRKEVGDGTIRKELWYLKAIVNVIDREWKLPEGPGLDLKPDRQVTNYLEEDEFQSVLPYLSVEILPVVVVARYTGLRLGDVVDLKWSMVDFEGKVVSVKTAKTGKEVRIPLAPQVVEVLTPLKKVYRLGSGFVFDHRPTRSAFRARVQRVFKGAVRTNGRPEIRFHDLRHSFCSSLAQAGVQSFLIAELAGHSSLQTTKRYTHFADSSKREAIAKTFANFAEGVNKTCTV
ncbi:MAG: site-specific integrase [Nitrospinae bacterium]|nr:site-specific integrase [Nitrospinota bacterium]